MVRTVVQQQATAFERQCDDRAQDLWTVPVGTFWQDADGWIDSCIKDLDQERRARSVIYRLSKAADDCLLERARASMREQIEMDLESLGDLPSTVERTLQDRVQGLPVALVSVTISMPPNLESSAC